jgi:hypothetical protein
MRSCHAKKECQIHRSWLATASSMTVQPSACPEYCPCHAKGQFFHSQRVQSMLPSIPRNPLFSLMDKSRWVSSRFGSRKCFAEDRNDSSTKIIHGLNACRLAHAHVLINKIAGYSISKHLYNSRAFLIWREAKFTCSIRIASEIWVVEANTDMSKTYLLSRTLLLLFLL